MYTDGGACKGELNTQMQTTLVSFCSCSWDLYPCPFLVFDLFFFKYFFVYGSYIQNGQKNRYITNNKTKQKEKHEGHRNKGNWDACVCVCFCICFRGLIKGNGFLQMEKKNFQIGDLVSYKGKRFN